MVGLNSKFKKVFVTTNNTLLASGTTTDLADGQLGIFNGETYVADDTPTWAEHKGIMIAQGTQDMSGFPKGAGMRNETDKTKVILGRRITGWRKKVYSAGQSNIVAIGYNGDTDDKDTHNMTVKCDEIKHLYIKLTGRPVENLFPGGHLVHVQAQGPCCDNCGDSCEDLDPTDMRNEFYDRLMEYKVLGGIYLFKDSDSGDTAIANRAAYVNVTKVETTNTAGDPTVGLKFEGAFVEPTSDECYFNIFPYNADPVYIEVSEWDPNWHGQPERCISTFPVTTIQEATYPFGAGQWVQRYEADAKRWDGMEFHEDMALRKAYKDRLLTDETVNYDKYTLSFEFKYKVLGWSDEYTDRYDVEVFVQTGQTAFKTAINAYISSITGTDVEPVA